MGRPKGHNRGPSLPIPRRECRGLRVLHPLPRGLLLDDRADRADWYLRRLAVPPGMPDLRLLPLRSMPGGLSVGGTRFVFRVRIRGRREEFERKMGERKTSEH